MSDILGLLAEHAAGRRVPADALAACSLAETEQAHVSELHGGWGCRLTKPVPGPALLLQLVLLKFSKYKIREKRKCDISLFVCFSSEWSRMLIIHRTYAVYFHLHVIDLS